jgi:hypothetical protein
VRAALLVTSALMAGFAAPDARAQQATAPAAATAASAPSGVAQKADDKEAEYEHVAIRYSLVGGRLADVYEGSGYHPLTGKALYVAVERPDLVRRYEVQQTKLLVLGLAGVAALGGGLAYGYTCCRAANADHTPSWIGLSVAALGFVAIPIALAEWEVATPEEVRAAVDAHDARLRRRLGLAPAPLPGGAGAVVTGSF